MSRIQKIGQAASSGDFALAVREIAFDPPYNQAVPQRVTAPIYHTNPTKDADRKAVVQALVQFKKETDMSSAVASLNEDQVDILMKYVYAGLSIIPEKGQETVTDALLKWHAVLVSRGGLGCVTRVLADRTWVL